MVTKAQVSKSKFVKYVPLENKEEHPKEVLSEDEITAQNRADWITNKFAHMEYSVAKLAMYDFLGVDCIVDIADLKQIDNLSNVPYIIEKDWYVGYNIWCPKSMIFTKTKREFRCNILNILDLLSHNYAAKDKENEFVLSRPVFWYMKDVENHIPMYDSQNPKGKTKKGVFIGWYAKKMENKKWNTQNLTTNQNIPNGPAAIV